MTTYANRVPTHIIADSASKLEKKISTIAALSGQMVDVITIQNIGGRWFCWYYHKLDDLNNPRPIADQVKTETTTKGRSKRSKG